MKIENVYSSLVHFGKNVFSRLTHLGVNKKISDYNLTRQCIRNYFPSRNCFVFPSPASTENMIHLENLKEQELAPDFLEVTGRFCDHVFHKSSVKTLKGGHRVTGKCECFTNLIVIGRYSSPIKQAYYLSVFVHFVSAWASGADLCRHNQQW